MDTGGFSIDIATLGLVFLLIVIVLSVITILNWLLGPSSSLKRNIDARVEAARNPETVAAAARADVWQKRFWAIIFFIFLIWMLFWADEEAFVQLVSSVLQKIADVSVWLLQMLIQFLRQLL